MKRRAGALTLHLTHLPESICNLHALTTLHITYCNKLTHLPERFGRLRALTRFCIKFCYNLTHLPDSFGNLQALTEIVISCKKLTHTVLPNSICFCKNLQSIQISNINMLPHSMILLEKLNDIQVMDKYGIRTKQNINEMRLIWYRILKNQCI